MKADNIVKRSDEELELRIANLKDLNALLKKDITNYKQAEELLKRRAFYDQLTGLPNRVLFIEQLRRVIEQKKQDDSYQFALLCMDIDRFKVIDDSLGHSAGDQLLVSVAKRIKSCVSSKDTVARFGGDEFAVLLDGIEDLNNATLISDKIQKELSLPFRLGGQEVSVTVSIGIVPGMTVYEREEDILRDADSAMYHAKSLGRARYEVFNTDIRVRAKKLIQLEAELRRACERNEFLVYYQPIISMTDIRIVGAEALVRWKHPQRGIVPPLDFIPLAESTGLIFDIGEIVMRQACAQNRRWQDEGHQKLLMGLNFSPRHFLSVNFTDIIKGVLEETGMDAQFLNIEITERTAMEDESLSVLNELSKIETKISIDDFGTGYSSLAALKRFPIDTLKIDISFIRDITKDPNADAIVAAIIAMAHSLKLKVVAEGVETKEQLEFLDSQLCDEIQGFFYSPPVPVNEFTGLLEKGVYKSFEIQSV